MSVDGLINNEYPAIYRLYNTGEVLENVRFVTTSFNSSSYNRYDIGVQLWPKSLFRGHCMNILACGFASIIAKTPENEQGEHYYQRRVAKEQVYQGKICKKFRKDQPD